MITAGNILFGSGGLAIGLAGSYFLAPNEKSGSSTHEPRSSPITKSTRSTNEWAVAHRNREIQKPRQSIPLSKSYLDRENWFEELIKDDVPQALALSEAYQAAPPGCHPTC